MVFSNFVYFFVDINCFEVVAIRRVSAFSYVNFVGLNFMFDVFNNLWSFMCVFFLLLLMIGVVDLFFLFGVVIVNLNVSSFFILISLKTGAFSMDIFVFVIIVVLKFINLVLVL